METIQVRMNRSHLQRVPQFFFKDGFDIRPFRPGDEQTWLRVWKEADAPSVNEKTFGQEFGRFVEKCPRRMLFVTAPGGREVGTIASWFSTRPGVPWGVIHWVAVSKDYQGKGLAKPMMTAAMNRMWDLGHRRAYLITQTPRTGAIKLYLDFGFVPDLTHHDNARKAWEMVNKVLHHPVIDAALAANGANKSE